MSPDSLALAAGAAAIAAPTLATAAAYRVHVTNASAHGLTLLATLAAAGVLALSAAGAPPSATISLTAIALCALAIAAFDARLFLIPDGLVVTLAALALSAAFAPPPLVQALGAAALGGLFLAVRLFHQRVRGAEGLGLGDVKLGAAMGLALGPERGLIAVAAAALIAAAWLIVTRRSASTADGASTDAVAAAAPFGAPLALVLVASVAMELAAVPAGATGAGR